jgi:hypothetical protein
MAAIAGATAASPAVTAASEQSQVSTAASSHTSSTAARSAVNGTARRASVPAGGGQPTSTVTASAPVVTAPATPTASPSVVRQGILFGSSLNLANGGGSFDSALASQDKKYGKLGIVRVFYPGFPASFASHPQLNTRPSIISFKVPAKDILSGAYDARFKAWFASAPKTTDVFWTYWHEPENDGLNLADYRAAWARLARLSHTANNSHLHATLILMGWTLRENSGRNWRNYYAGNSSIDVLGFDIYNTGVKNTGTYKSADKLYSLAASVAKSVGKPWGLAETATLLARGDTTGSGQAAWLRSNTQFLIDNGASFASYFDTLMPGGDFRLTKALSIQAWSSAVAKSKM